MIIRCEDLQRDMGASVASHTRLCTSKPDRSSWKQPRDKDGLYSDGQTKPSLCAGAWTRTLLFKYYHSPPHHTHTHTFNFFLPELFPEDNLDSSLQIWVEERQVASSTFSLKSKFSKMSPQVLIGREENVSFLMTRCIDLISFPEIAHSSTLMIILMTSSM